jgi:hypothetical protein
MNGFNFLYNSRSNSFFKLDGSLYEEIILVESGRKGIDSLSSDTYELLKSKGIIVEDYDDKNFISQTKDAVRRDVIRFGNCSHFGLQFQMPVLLRIRASEQCNENRCSGAID